MDYEKAASLWEEKDATSKKMDRVALWTEMEKFIQGHNTCALATGYGDFVRCTPIEYNFKDGKFWLLSEGGLKFRALQHNSNVCLAIFDPYVGFGKLGGMQVTGTAAIAEPMSKDYLDILALKGIPVSGLKKLPHEIHLIRIVPERIDFLWSEFKKLGYDSRQFLTFPASDS